MTVVEHAWLRLFEQASYSSVDAKRTPRYATGTAVAFSVRIVLFAGYSSTDVRRFVDAVDTALSAQDGLSAAFVPTPWEGSLGGVGMIAAAALVFLPHLLVREMKTLRNLHHFKRHRGE